MNITSATFVKSAAHRIHSPALPVPEVAIIGRSNVGKSSLINFLTNHKELAKASKVPGKTQLINFFLINEEWMLVDFPGYGYAKHSYDTREKWMDTMQDYLTNKNNLRMVLLLVNSHLPPQKADMLMMQALAESEIPFWVVLTKTDKSTTKKKSQLLKDLKHFWKEHNIPHPDMILETSSLKKRGLQKILDSLESVVSE